MNFNHGSVDTSPLNFNMRIQSIRNISAPQQHQKQRLGMGQKGAEIFGQQSQSYGLSNNISSSGQTLGQYIQGSDYDTIRTVASQQYQSRRTGRSDPWDSSSQADDDFNDDYAGIGGSSQGRQSLMSTNLGQTSRQQQQQQMVMLVRPGNTGTGELMGTIQTSPGQFSLQQQPMQVILQGVNADSFGQFGQGSNVMMGLMNQRQQPKSLFDESIMEDVGRGGGRFSPRPRLIPRRGSSRSATRRLDYFTSNSKNTTNRGSINASSATSSGDKKRVVRDRLGRWDEDRKRRRMSPPNGNQGHKIDHGRPKFNQERKSDQASSSKVKQDNVNPSPLPGYGGRGNKQRRKRANRKSGASTRNNNNQVTDDQSKQEAKDKKDDAQVKSDGKEEKPTDDRKMEEDHKEEIAKYEAIPSDLLACKICQTVHTDIADFVQHLHGSDHVALAKILEKRFEQREKLLKSESTLLEDEIAVKFKKQRPMKKSKVKGSRNYCAMCDCTYSANWGVHRNSLIHRALKEFLYPTCRCCKTSFLSRMDWANHFQSVDHLGKLAEMKESGQNVHDHESTFQDELFAVHVEMKDEQPIPIVFIRSTGYKVPTKEDLRELLRDEKGELFLPPGEVEMPGDYSLDQAYAEDAILTVEGATCKVCRIFIENKAHVLAHIKSKSHYGMYINYLRKVIKLREMEEQEKIDKKAAAAAYVEKQNDEEIRTEQEEEEEDETTMETDDALVIDETPMDADDEDKNDNDSSDDVSEKTEEVEVPSTPVDFEGENIQTVADTEKEEESGDDKQAGDKQEAEGKMEVVDVAKSDAEKVEPETMKIVEPEVVVVQPKFKIPKLTAAGRPTQVKQAPAPKPVPAKPPPVKQAPVRPVPARQTPVRAAAPMKILPPPAIGKPKAQPQQKK